MMGDRGAQKIRHIRQHQIVNTDGRNYLVKDCILRIKEITTLKFILQGFIIFLVLKGLGMVEKKMHQPLSAEK